MVEVQVWVYQAEWRVGGLHLCMCVCVCLCACLYMHACVHKCAFL